MPLDPIIARGVAPIDVSNTLYQMAVLKRADENSARADRYQNALIARSNRQDMRTRMDREAAAGLQEKQQALAKVEWALASPSPAKAILDDPEAVKAFTGAGMDLTGLNDDKARQLLMQARVAMASALGQGPPAAEKPETMRVGDEIVRVGPEGVTPLYRGKSNFAPQQPRQPTEYELYKQDPEGYAAWKAAQREGQGGAGVTIGPDGQLMAVPDPAKATEGERTSANYLGRMEAAEQLLGDYVPDVRDYAAARAVMQNGPVVASFANNVLSPDGQKYYQAASDWVRAKLRKESGAVISPQEMEQEIKTYFPVPGDKPGTVAQKRAARAQAQRGMRMMGGRAVVSDGEPQGEQESAQPTAQPTNDPLSQYADQIIRQGGKRYQVMQGADGRYFAQELK